MNLEQLQRAFLDLITQPLTASDGMRARTADGRSVKALADALIKPSGRVTSFERLELYNTGYWFRILDWFAEDFPGLRTIIGPRNFDKLSAAYLHECPPTTDLRNLGGRLETWLRAHPRYTPKRERLALDMVRLEWADIEASDSAELPRLAAQDLGGLGPDPRFRLQPGLRLLDLAYPVDKLLLTIRGIEKEHSTVASNAVPERRPRCAGKRYSLPKPRNVFLAVHRHERVVHFKRLDRAAFGLLRGLQERRRLSQAIEGAVSFSNTEVERISAQVQHWFSEWSLLGWITK